MEDCVKWILEDFPSSVSFSFPKKLLAVIVLALENKTSNYSVTKIRCSTVFLQLIVPFFFFLDCTAKMKKKFLARTFWDNFTK